MTLPIPMQAGVLVVGTIVYVVDDVGAAMVSADYPDVDSAIVAAVALVTDQRPLLDPQTYKLFVYAASNRPPGAAPGIAPDRPVSPPHQNVPLNHPSVRGSTNDG